MCGIVGLWNLDQLKIDQRALDRFTDTLAHRGPDGRGTYIDASRHIGLGHRRLAILDPTESARQPMAYANKRYWITYNGEIYNFLELREELEGYGHRFRSQSDTEVVLAAYCQWGEECQLKFNGMWAFAIWDSREQILFLSRDRFGIKPFHYYHDKRRFAFASEMKAFLALDWFEVIFDEEHVARAILVASSIEGTENCLLKNLKRLKAGHCLILKKGQEPRIRRWWNTLDHLEEAPKEDTAQVEKFRSLFFDSCRIRMRSDVPLGTSLSGGMDSSSVLCAMSHIMQNASDQQRMASNWQSAFVAAFPGTGQDERQYAEEVIHYTRTQPVIQGMNPLKAIENIDQIIFAAEEVDDFLSSIWEIYRLMRNRNIVISMDGHGGDELLAGYWEYPAFALGDAAFPWPKFNRILEYDAIYKSIVPQKSGMKNIRHQEYIKAGKKKILTWPVTHFIRKFLGYDNKETLRNKWLRVPLSLEMDSEEYQNDQERIASWGLLNQSLYFDLHYKFLPTILRNFDRCSMAHGVEVRTPFLDWRLVCYCFSLPERMKLGAHQSKRILREAMKGYMPERIRTRTEKIGFKNPMEQWLNGELKGFVLDFINSSTFLQSTIWNGPQIRDDVINAFNNKGSDRIKDIWKFVQANRLMALFKKNYQGTNII